MMHPEDQRGIGAILAREAEIRNAVKEAFDQQLNAKTQTEKDLRKINIRRIAESLLPIYVASRELNPVHKALTEATIIHDELDKWQKFVI